MKLKNAANFWSTSDKQGALDYIEALEMKIEMLEAEKAKSGTSQYMRDAVNDRKEAFQDRRVWIEENTRLNSKVGYLEGKCKVLQEQNNDLAKDNKSLQIELAQARAEAERLTYKPEIVEVVGRPRQQANRVLPIQDRSTGRFLLEGGISRDEEAFRLAQQGYNNQEIAGMMELKDPDSVRKMINRYTKKKGGNSTSRANDDSIDVYAEWVKRCTDGGVILGRC